MNIRLLKTQDTKALEEYLDPHKAECMFICSNLKLAGIDYKGADFEGKYFGYFDKHDCRLERLLGVIVHYWNCNIMMHASSMAILEELAPYLKTHINRPVAGVLGPDLQAEYVINCLSLSNANFSVNRREGLYEVNLHDLNEISVPDNLYIVSSQDISMDLLINWMEAYDNEALGASSGSHRKKQTAEDINRRLKKDNSWVLLLDGTPVALSAFNARLADMVQVGPVWTPPEYRNKGFARLLLAYTLHQEKLKGIKKAILFTDNPAAIKAYEALGFNKIGDYRLALLERPMKLQEVEFTTSPLSTDIDFLTQKINEEAPEYGAAHPFAFFIRNEKNQIIAGCNGSVIFGCIYTDQLWVDKNYRKQGLGTQLMESVHKYGRKSGCTIATVNTMSFQSALAFYKKLGYAIDFERDGYVKGMRCLFFKRKL